MRCGRVNDVLNQFRNLLRPPWPEKGNALTSAFKHVVVFGELNFRVEMPRCVVPSTVLLAPSLVLDARLFSIRLAKHC